MTTRDVLRWNFAPWDMLVIAGVAIAGFAISMCDVARDGIEKRLDAWLESMENA